MILRKALPLDPEWRRLHQIADRLRPEYRREFLAAVERTAGAIVLRQVEDALARGDYAAAEAAVPWERMASELGGLAVVLRTGFERSAGAAIDLLPRAITLRFDLLNPRATDWVRRQTGLLIRDVTAETQLAVREVIARAFEVGMHPYEAARHIRQLVGLTSRQAAAVDRYYRKLLATKMNKLQAKTLADNYATKLKLYRAETIAHTETLAASNAGQQELWRQAAEAGYIDPYRMRRVWVTAGDERVCEWCESLAGAEVALEQDFSVTANNRTLTTLTPPLHPNCVAGDTRISTSHGITGASKRWYEGEFIVVRTASGKQLTCTPNHPILTPDGWVAAGVLDEGSYVVGCSGTYGIADLGVNDDQHMPPTIEEVAQAFGQAGKVSAVKVPVSAPDFHGDGQGSKVAVIYADWLLGNRFYPAFSEHDGELRFERRDRMLSAIVGVGDADTLTHSDFATTAGFMRGGDLGSAAFGQHLRPLQGFSLASVAGTDPSLQQAAAGDATVNPQELAAHVLGSAAFVETDEVVNIERYTSAQYVFNLQTSEHIFVANGIITHNCRCVLVLEERSREL